MSRFLPIAVFVVAVLGLAPLPTTAQNAVTSCGPFPCPNGFGCVTSEPGVPGRCLALNPCEFADCGDGFFCDLDFTLERCNSEEVPGGFFCIPAAVCKPNSAPISSECSPVNTCQGSFQICLELLEDPEECFFSGEYDSPDECDSFRLCVNPRPNFGSCSANTCPDGFVCAVSLVDPQGCAQSPIYEGIEECQQKSECVPADPCDFVSCPSNTECVKIFDPSEECLSNDIDECPAVAQCVPIPDPCASVDCPFGFTCIAPSFSSEAECLPINPCNTADCGDGLFCDLIFAEDRCNPLGSGGSFTCAPLAVCRPDFLPPISDCGPSNPCQASFQLCAEELDDPEACFGGAYESPEDCDTSSDCLNPPFPAIDCNDDCPGGLICSVSLADPQGCAQSPIYEGIEECQKKAECVVTDPCTDTVCPSNSVCTKIFDPSEECLSNNIDECPTVAQCVPIPDPCASVDCPFGFTCIADEDPFAPAQCLPINPCNIVDCGSGFFCDLVFSEDQCSPLGSPGSFTCAPVAVCKPDSSTPISTCGPSNPCQGSFQLCVEELDDPEACFGGAYENPEDCQTSGGCLNPPPTVSSCASLTCSGGLTCVQALLDPQGCAQSQVYEGIEECQKKAVCVLPDPCSVVSCPLGTVCTEVFDPSEECLGNSLDVCPTIAECQ